MSPALAGTFFTTSTTWETHLILEYSLFFFFKEIPEILGWGGRDKGSGEEDRGPATGKGRAGLGAEGDFL